MKKVLALVSVLVLLLSCVPAMAWENGVVVKVGIVGSTNEYWTVAMAEKMKAEGIILEFTTFSDYNMPNIALSTGEIDMNSFQHYNYLAKWQADNAATYPTPLAAIGETLVAPLSLYSKKYASLDELKDGDTVLVMNDPTNEARALNMLVNAGLITLAETAGEFATALDIKDNPKNLNIIEMAADVIGAQMEDPSVAVGFLNGQYATQAGFNHEQALLVEAFDPTNAAQHGIVNIIAVREADLNNELYQHIAKSFQCAEVAEVFNTLYAGSFVPAWSEEEAAAQ